MPDRSPGPRHRQALRLIPNPKSSTLCNYQRTNEQIFVLSEELGRDGLRVNRDVSVNSTGGRPGADTNGTEVISHLLLRPCHESTRIVPRIHPTPNRRPPLIERVGKGSASRWIGMFACPKRPLRITRIMTMALRPWPGRPPRAGTAGLTYPGRNGIAVASSDGLPQHRLRPSAAGMRLMIADEASRESRKIGYVSWR